MKPIIITNHYKTPKTKWENFLLIILEEKDFIFSCPVNCQKKALTKSGALKEVRVKMTLAKYFPLCQIPNLFILNLIYKFKRSDSTSPTRVNVTECLLV